MAGTVNHVARAGMKYMYDIQQFDCIDSSRNTTSLLLVLDQLNLLRFHDVDVPESRGHLFTRGPRMRRPCSSKRPRAPSGR